MSESVTVQGITALRKYDTAKYEAPISGGTKTPTELAKLEDIQTAVQQTAAKMLVISLNNKNEQTANGPSIKEIPELALPTEQARLKAQKTAGLSALVGELMKIIANVNNDKLHSRLSQLFALSQSKSANNLLLSNEYNRASQESEKARKQAEADGKEFATATDNHESAKSACVTAIEKLAAMKPGDIGYEQAQDELSKANARQLVTGLAAGVAKEKALASAHTASEKTFAADKLWDRLQKLTGLDKEMLTTTGQQNLTGLAAMTLLLGELSKLIGDNADSKVQANAELTKNLQEARQKEMEIKAKDQAEQIRKAEQLNKTMGCVGKILGGLIIAVSIVGAVFSGGASLALAAVGIALLVADPIVAKITGKSITDRVMAPVLEHIIQPIMKFIAEKIKSALEDLGVKENIANIISTVSAAISIAIMVIAVGIVAKKGAEALLKRVIPVINKMITKVIDKTLPAAVKNTASKVSSTMSKSIVRLGEQLGIENNAASYRRFARNIQRAVVSTDVLKTTVEVTNSIKTGIATKKVADAEADIVIAMADIKLIGKYLKQAIEIFNIDNKAKLDIIESISTLNLSRQQTNLSIINLQRI